jgi:hypothetical protein
MIAWEPLLSERPDSGRDVLEVDEDVLFALARVEAIARERSSR